MDNNTRERLCGLIMRSEAIRITVEGGDISLTVRDREFCHNVGIALRKVARKRGSDDRHTYRTR